MQSIAVSGGGIVNGEAEAYVYGDTVPYDIQRRAIAFDILKSKKNMKLVMDKLPDILCIDRPKTYARLKIEVRKLYQDCSRETEAHRLIIHYQLYDRIENMLDIIRLKQGGGSWKAILADAKFDPDNLKPIAGKPPRLLAYQDLPKKPNVGMMEQAEYIIKTQETLEKYLNDMEIYTSKVCIDLKKLL